MRIHWHQRHLKGRNRIGPDNPGFVVVLLNGGGDHAGYADTVAAHPRVAGFAVIAQHVGVHGLGIFLAKLENVTDFNAALDGERTLAIGRRIAFNDIA